MVFGKVFPEPSTVHNANVFFFASSIPHGYPTEPGFFLLPAGQNPYKKSTGSRSSALSFLFHISAGGLTLYGHMLLHGPDQLQQAAKVPLLPGRREIHRALPLLILGGRDRDLK